MEVQRVNPTLFVKLYYKTHKNSDALQIDQYQPTVIELIKVHYV